MLCLFQQSIVIWTLGHKYTEASDKFLCPKYFLWLSFNTVLIQEYSSIQDKSSSPVSLHKVQHTHQELKEISKKDVYLKEDLEGLEFQIKILKSSMQVWSVQSKRNLYYTIQLCNLFQEQPKKHANFWKNKFFYIFLQDPYLVHKYAIISLICWTVIMPALELLLIVTSSLLVTVTQLLVTYHNILLNFSSFINSS